MTKSDLIEHLCQAEKIPKGKAELLVNAIFDCMEEALRRGERIEIRGFGSFEIRHYKPYDGRNPRTGTQVPVKAKRLPFFKVGKELKERVNGAPISGSDDDDDDDDDKPAGNGTSNGHAVPSPVRAEPTEPSAPGPAPVGPGGDSPKAKAS